ncbi:RsmD family RNA methyltransferase [Candidatus Woesearchaeota archaeon]|nr:RsmD family RNA methyltransferase [Candidatus Woesearchaeota archaeon]
MHTKSSLAIELSNLNVFSKAKVKLEQYPTDSEIAAAVLWTAYMNGDIQDKVIADLGSGTGILGIGALLLGAKFVYFLDIDREVLNVLRENIENYNNPQIKRNKYKVVHKTIEEINKEYFMSLHADVVIQNPPFGTKEKHIDRLFLEKAFGVAPVIYSFHKIATKKFVEAFCRDNNFIPKLIDAFNFPLKATMKFHKKKIEKIEVGCWRIEKSMGADLHKKVEKTEKEGNKKNEEILTKEDNKDKKEYEEKESMESEEKNIEKKESNENTETTATKDWSSDFVHYWKNYKVPARASPSDLSFIKKKILGKIAQIEKDGGKKEDIKVLVLGATPEYRNLCGELGIPVTLFDFKRYNYEYLATEVKNKPKEKFIEGNWLTTILEDKFDVVLADNVLDVVMKEDIPTILKNISNILKKEGIFMPRTYIRDKDEHWTGEKVIKEYRKEGSKKPFYTWVIRNFYLSAYDSKKEFVVLKDVWTVITSLHDKSLLTDEELEICELLSLDREFKFHIPLREELDKMLKEFFTIKEIFFGTELYLKRKLSLHVLMKK